jgi:hypothetical protein
MKIFLAGNTPDREKEEKVLIKKKLSQRRLISFYFLFDKAIFKMFKLWKNENLLRRDSRD